MAGAETWTTPADWTAEQVVDETDMNEQVRDNLTYIKARGSLLKTVMCSATAANQSIPDQAVTPITMWTADAWDTDSMHDTGTNPERLTAPIAGLYLVQGELRYTTGQGSMKVAQIYKNSTAAANLLAQEIDWSTQAIINLSVPTKLASGEFVLMAAYQYFAGATTAWTVLGGGNSWFGMTRLGDAS